MKKILKYIPLLLFIAFFGLFFAYQNGYYERITRDKIKLTNEQIEKFEQDVLEGQDVTIEDYVSEDKDYTTRTSKMSLKVSNKLENIIDSGIKYIFTKISNMIE